MDNIQILKRTRELACEIDPRLAEFCSRRYSNLTGYPLKHLKDWLATFIGSFAVARGATIEAKLHDMISGDPNAVSISSAKSNVHVSHQILDLGVPLFAVERQYLKELLSMEPSLDWNIDQEALLPFPGFAILLPDGILAHNGEPVSMFTVGTVSQEEDDGRLSRILFINIHTTETGQILHNRSFIEQDGTVIFNHTPENFEACNLDTPSDTMTDLHMLTIGTYLVMAMVCTINSSFGSVTPGVSPKGGSGPAKSRKDKHRPFWVAPVISAERISRGYSPPETNGEKHHKRPHIRRAHWHTVLHGPGRTQRKKIRYPMSYIHSNQQ